MVPRLRVDGDRSGCAAAALTRREDPGGGQWLLGLSNCIAWSKSRRT